MRIRLPVQTRTIALLCMGIAAMVCGPPSGFCQNASWTESVRNYIAAQQLDAALGEVEARLRESPQDLEARGWRGRLLAWKGRWAEAEQDYRAVLQAAPNDIEIISGLADVLLWQGNAKQALPLLNRARSLAPADGEVLLHRSRVSRALGDLTAARAQLDEILLIQPHNLAASNAIAELRQESHHELRFGTEIDTFSFADTAGAQTIALISRWMPRWSSDLSVSAYQRFSEHAGKYSASGTFRFTSRDWLTAGGTAARVNGIIPNRELLLEYGHGFRFDNPAVKGLEASYQQHWLWYRGAHVLTVGISQTVYFPKDWTWRIAVNGARSGFTGSGVEWVPSGATRLGFHVYRGLSRRSRFFARDRELYPVGPNRAYCGTHLRRRPDVSLHASARFQRLCCPPGPLRGAYSRQLRTELWLPFLGSCTRSAGPGWSWKPFHFLCSESSC